MAGMSKTTKAEAQIEVLHAAVLALCAPLPPERAAARVACSRRHLRARMLGIAPAHRPMLRLPAKWLQFLSSGSVARPHLHWTYPTSADGLGFGLLQLTWCTCRVIHRACLWTDRRIGQCTERAVQRIRAHALVCFMALVLHRVMRMRLKANDREESPTRLLQQLQRIHQQTVRTADGQAPHGLTEMTPAQKSLFTVLRLPLPTLAELSQPVL
jgi:hypothetical protein